MIRKVRHLIATVLLVCAAASTAGIKPVIAQGKQTDDQTVVPPDRRVSDREARLAKARVLATKNATVRPALDAYRSLAKEYPDDREIRNELASILMRVNLFDEALASWQLILQQEPDNLQARLNAGKCYLWTNRATNAIQYLESAVASHPETAETYMFLARAYTSVKSHDKAIVRAEQYRRLKGINSFEGQSEVGDAHFGASELSEAISAYKAALAAPHSSIPKGRLFDVRKRLGLSQSWNQESEVALPLLAELNNLSPGDDLIAIELARAYSRRGDYTRVVPTLERVLARTSKDDKLKWDAADLFLAIGHFRQASKLYAEVVSANPSDDTLSLSYADRMSSWGAFDEAARRYRKYLEKSPNHRLTMLKLARCLASSEQTEEAEAVYRTMLAQRSDDDEAFYGLVSLKLLEGNETAAQNLISASGSSILSTPESLSVRGDVAVERKDFEAALGYFQELEKSPAFEQSARNKRAQTLAKAGKVSEARNLYIQTAEKFPKDIESRFYIERNGKELSDNFVTRLTSNPEIMPVDLLEWGRLSIKAGDTRTALRFYEEAAKRDPDFIPVKMAFAELLGVENQYDKSIDVYKMLLTDFPGSTKIRTEHARTLAFAGRYKEGIAEFERINHDFPMNRVSIREAARVAFWGKRVDQGTKLYKSLLVPSVDQTLSKRLTEIGESSTFSQNDSPSIEGFERALSELEKAPHRPTDTARNNVAVILGSLYGEYRLQKEVSLELASKTALWNRRPRDARRALDELVAFEPGNKEAIFDLAQVSCAQDDLSDSKACYDRLLSLAPLHKIAPEARERLADRRAPAFLSSAYARSENGRGELARFSRSLFTAGFETPVSDSTTFAVLANYAREVPHDKRRSYDSLGPTLDTTTRFNNSLKANAHWTYRSYEDDEFDARHTGAATVWYSYADWVELSAGYERSDEIYNRFGLEDGIQSDAVWFALDGKLTRSTEYRLSVRQLWYTDSNDRQILSFDIAEALTEQPRTLKIGFRGEYHDTSEENVFIAGPSGVEDIVHPYWTPKQYGSGFLTIEWFHELAEILFCHQRRHYYRLRTEPFMATDGNVGAELSAEWMIELENRLGFGARGSLQRSQLYDAEQGLFFVRYAF